MSKTSCALFFCVGYFGLCQELYNTPGTKSHPFQGLIYAPKQMETRILSKNQPVLAGKDYYFYACKHRKQVNGVRCNYDRQWNQETVNKAVEETIRKVVNNPDFEAAMRKKIDSRVDTSSLAAEMENLQKALRQLISAKDRLGQQMDALDVTDKHYDKKYEDMQARLDEFYDKIDAAQEEIAELQSRIDFLIAQKISSDNVYKYLLYFDKLYDKFTDKEKKTFLGSFVEKIEIYPTETPNGRILKRIQFRFPLFYDGEEIIGLSWDNETTLECCVLMCRE